MKTNIIAEVGSNHNGSLKTALEYISAAKECGADAVKFQTIQKEKLVSPFILSDDGIVENPAYSAFANYNLPEEWHFKLKDSADRVGIEFLSTPFYIEAIDLLERVGVRRYKIASGDITFYPLLKAVGRTKKPVILSTGASSLDEITTSINVLKDSGTNDISLLHCVSNYPPLWTEMNLKSITTMKDIFKLQIGISDHTPGYSVPVAAVALGATIIEKHITFDRSLPGPDHAFAITIEEFAEMISQVRCIEKALGSGNKIPVDSEKSKQYRMRRSVYDPATLEPTDSPYGIWLRPAHSLSKK